MTEILEMIEVGEIFCDFLLATSTYSGVLEHTPISTLCISRVLLVRWSFVPFACLGLDWAV